MREVVLAGEGGHTFHDRFPVLGFGPAGRQTDHRHAALTLLVQFTTVLVLLLLVATLLECSQLG